MTITFLQKLVFWCGIGHFVLCLGSLFVPVALQWRLHLKVLQPLLRQMFWTYAAYILVINAAFGVISVFGTEELLNRSFLANSLTLFIGLYWVARVAIQFLYFDRSVMPGGFKYLVGEVALVCLFILFSVTYFIAFFYNSAWI